MVVSMKKKGPYTLSLLRVQNTLLLGCRENVPRRHVAFAAPDSTVVGVDLTTDTKRTAITEKYRVQKSLVVLYPMRHMHTNHLICIREISNYGPFVRLEM
jgi:hypothetical protein